MLSRLIFPTTRLNILNFGRRICKSSIFLKEESVEAKAETDEPVKFTTSKAGKWKAKYSLYGEDVDDTPPSQRTFIMLSLYSALVYFTLLREENDIDDWLRNIETDVPIIAEEESLHAQIAQAIREKKDTKILQKRLERIKEIRKKMKQAEMSAQNHLVEKNKYMNQMR